MPVTRVKGQAHWAAVGEQNTVLVKISIVLKYKIKTEQPEQDEKSIHLMPGEGTPFLRLLGDQLGAEEVEVPGLRVAQEVPHSPRHPLTPGHQPGRVVPGLPPQRHLETLLS